MATTQITWAQIAKTMTLVAGTVFTIVASTAAVNTIVTRIQNHAGRTTYVQYASGKTAQSGSILVSSGGKLFIVDATKGFVGVGTLVPSSSLDIVQTSGSPMLTLRDPSGVAKVEAGTGGIFRAVAYTGTGQVWNGGLIGGGLWFTKNDPGVGSAPNIKMGYAGNVVEGFWNTILGGGSAGQENKILCTLNIATCYLGVIAGGYDNIMDSAYPAFIGGGSHNRITWPSTHSSTLGSLNTLLAGDSTIILGSNNSVQRLDGQGPPNYASIGGGIFNIVGAQSAAIGGGQDNKVPTWGGFIGGGYKNRTASGGTSNFQSILGGFQNQIHPQASAATILGGTSNQVGTGSSYAVASGLNAATQMYGEMAHANGMFLTAGDSQMSDVIGRRQTTTATPTVIRLDGNTSSKRITIPADTTWGFTVTLVARSTTAGTGALYIFNGALERSGALNTTRILGSVTKSIENEDASATDLDASITADTTNGALNINITGDANATINWTARVAITQVSG